ncbi:MAG TPA: cytochrome c, partial [Halomonas sp.]|nr:cytochrome c [Halomonas sp.]
EEFDQWLVESKAAAEQEASGADREWTLDELMERGKKTYATICASCHQPDGGGSPPAFPALAGNQALMDEPQRHRNTVINGVSGTAMPAFRNTLNPVEIAAVITYERNAWGNETGDTVQPSDIAKQLSE